MRSVWAEIDLAAIKHNVEILRGLTRPGALFMAVVKANGYGHGAIQVSEAAIAAGADRLGVATIEEAMQLSKTGISVPIHILTEVPSDQADLCAAIRSGFILTVCREESARAISKAAAEIGQRAIVHVKVDTGMNRLGISSEPISAAEFIGGVLGFGNIDIEGIFTHFATADDPSSDFPRIQMERFTAVIEKLEAGNICPPIRHAANSAAIIAYPDSHLSMVRAGIAMYGLSPSGAMAGAADLKPALSLMAKISYIKDVAAGQGISYGLTFKTDKASRVATLPLGYADGYSRVLSNRTEVLIRGHRAENVGTICMDQFMVDVTGIPGAAAGDECVLIGQSGPETITADDIAGKIGTINYEVVCAISARVPRTYSV